MLMLILLNYGHVRWTLKDKVKHQQLPVGPTDKLAGVANAPEWSYARIKTHELLYGPDTIDIIARLHGAQHILTTYNVFTAGLMINRGTD